MYERETRKRLGGAVMFSMGVSREHVGLWCFGKLIE